MGAKRTGRPTGRPPSQPDQKRVVRNITIDPGVAATIDRIAVEKFQGNASRAVDFLITQGAQVQARAVPEYKPPTWPITERMRERAASNAKLVHKVKKVIKAEK